MAKLVLFSGPVDGDEPPLIKPLASVASGGGEFERRRSLLAARLAFSMLCAPSASGWLLCRRTPAGPRPQIDPSCRWMRAAGDCQPPACRLPVWVFCRMCVTAGECFYSLRLRCLLERLRRSSALSRNLCKLTQRDGGGKHFPGSAEHLPLAPPLPTPSPPHRSQSSRSPPSPLINCGSFSFCTKTRRRLLLLQPSFVTADLGGSELIFFLCCFYPSHLPFTPPLPPPTCR